MAEEGAQQREREREREKAGEGAREKAVQKERLMQPVKARRLRMGLERGRAGRGTHPQVHLLASHLKGEGQQNPKQRQSLSEGHEPSPRTSPNPEQKQWPHML